MEKAVREEDQARGLKLITLQKAGELAERLLIKMDAAEVIMSKMFEGFKEKMIYERSR